MLMCKLWKYRAFDYEHWLKMKSLMALSVLAVRMCKLVADVEAAVIV